MKRAIKFRGKRIDNGEWVYGYVFYNDEKAFIWGLEHAKIYVSEIIPRNHRDNVFQTDINIVSHTPVVFEVDPETVGQFTGMHDKNRKEIYEGDVYRAYGKNYQVMFVNGAFCGGVNEKSCSPLAWQSDIDSEELDTCDWCEKILEVIGNIYDTPELLK